MNVCYSTIYWCSPSHSFYLQFTENARIFFYFSHSVSFMCLLFLFIASNNSIQLTYPSTTENHRQLIIVKNVWKRKWDSYHMCTHIFTYRKATHLISINYVNQFCYWTMPFYLPIGYCFSFIIWPVKMKIDRTCWKSIQKLCVFSSFVSILACI